MTSDGNIDYIYDLFDRVESMHWSCKNCTKVMRREYGEGDFYCSGVIKRPLSSRPFDIIRECKVCYDSDGFIEQLDQAPDEVLSKITVLGAAVTCWLEANEKYIKFRDV